MSSVAIKAQSPGIWETLEYIRRHPTVAIGLGVLLLMTIIALLAPLITGDPFRLTHQALEAAK